MNDLDVDFSENPAASNAYRNDQRNIRKVKEATEKLEINIIHPLRPGKKLLVLDIDYSKLMHGVLIDLRPDLALAILDTKPLTSGSLPPAECARPGLHEFLEAIYPYYDSALISSFIHDTRRSSCFKSVFGMFCITSPGSPGIEFATRSQTSWIWLETKLVELGMIGSDRNYQVCRVRSRRHIRAHAFP